MPALASAGSLRARAAGAKLPFMSTPPPSPDALPEEAPRRNYHHGALREALLSAARRLISEKGVAGFSLSDASRLAGVSGAAPYRHFRDKEELVGEVARLGFVAFGERLQAAAAEASSEGGTAAFMAMGRAYLAFARKEPGAYAAMFMAGVKRGAANLGEAGDGAFATLIEGLKRAFGGNMPEGLDPVRLAFQIWAFSHGVAMLERDCADTMGFDAEDALLDGVQRLLSHHLPKLRRADP
jgi:AcrR family transcriptional regulator